MLTLSKPWYTKDPGTKKTAMENSGDLRNRLVSGFIVICIAMIAISGAFLSQNYLNLTFWGSVIIGVVFFLLLYLLHSHRLARREINELKYHMGGPSDIEDGLIRRIDELSRQIAASDMSSLESSIERISTDCKTNNASIQRVAEELLTVTSRLEEVADQIDDLDGLEEQRLESSAENKIVPLRKLRDPVAIPSAPPSAIVDQHVSQKPVFHDDFGTETAAISEIGSEIGATDLAEQRRNRTLINRLRIAIDNEALELHLQPVVKLIDREPEFYESTLRIKDNDGKYLSQQRLVRFVQNEQLAATFDRQLLHSAIRVLRTLNELQKRTGIFCPISTASLENAGAFEDIYAFLRANVALAGSLVLEIDQSALDRLDGNSRDRLSQLVDLGYSLLLNNIKKFDLDGALLHSAGFRNLKVSVNELLEISDDGNIDEYVTDFGEEMENCGLTVIVSDIEHETQAMHLIDFDLPLGLGTLFSPSRPVKPELLKAPDHEDGVSGMGIA